MIIEIKKSIKPIKYENAIALLEKRLNEINTKKKNELIWILEHEEVYTAGTSYKNNELLDKSIKLIKTNRGGKITYHGPGQLICYFVLDLNKRNKDIRKLINIIENTIIKTLKEYKFPKYSKCNKSLLLVRIYNHCESEGAESNYIGHAGGGIQVHNGEIYIGLGDTNIPSSVFNSIYTTRDANLPWGTILKFEFDYNLLSLVGIGNHTESNLTEVWIKGLRNPYRFSINKNSIWIADLGTSVEDEINLVPLNTNNVDLGWPYYEGDFAHQPFDNVSIDSIIEIFTMFVMSRFYYSQCNFPLKGSIIHFTKTE